jgi:hypothetical protein
MDDLPPPKVTLVDSKALKSPNALPLSKPVKEALKEEPKQSTVEVSRKIEEVIKKVEEKLPKNIKIRNSPNLWKFLVEQGGKFERTPEEHAREILTLVMRKANGE